MRAFSSLRPSRAFFWIAAVCGLATLGLAAMQAPARPWHRRRTVAIAAAPGGGEYFDYVYFDAASRRAYLSQGTTMDVVDVDSGKQVGRVSGLRRDHGVALPPGLGQGFISDGDAGEVAVFDVHTLRIIKHIPTAKDSDGMLYEPVDGRVWCFEGDPNSVSVIDPRSQSVVTTLPLGGAPEQAVTDGHGMIYDNLADKNQVAVINAHTLKVTARWPVAPAGEPVAMAMDAVHRKLFIGARNPAVMVEMDADSGKIVAGPFPIGPSVDSCVFDPGTAMAACSTRDGAIHVFHENASGIVTPFQVIKTEFGAKTMALDPRTHDFLTDTASRSASAPGRRPSFRPGTLHLLIYGR
jgi:YVTN family beta-propeller protein